MKEEREKNTIQHEKMNQLSIGTEARLKAAETERNTLQQQLFRTELAVISSKWCSKWRHDILLWNGLDETIKNYLIVYF